MLLIRSDKNKRRGGVILPEQGDATSPLHQGYPIPTAPLRGLRGLRGGGIFLSLMMAVFIGFLSSPSARSEPVAAGIAATLEQAATYFALGSFDAAEDEIRRYIAAHPSDADKDRRDDAIKLLAEIRIERERELSAVTTAGGHSGATANVETDRSAATVSPRVVDASILSSPPAQIPLKWERAFPGAPDKFRKDGVYAVTAAGEGARTVLKLFYSGSAQVAQQRTGTTLTIDIMGLTDALPRGGLDFPSGGALRLRHNQHSTEPVVTRIVIDLKTADARVTVTSGNEEIVIEIVQSSAGVTTPPEGGLYRAPVTSDRYKIDIIGGNFQRTMVGDALPEALAVKVTDASTGAPLADVPVEFITVNAGVVCAPTSAKTSADGAVSTRVTLAQTAGRKVIVARVPGGPAEVSFEEYGLPRPPDSLRKVAGEDAKVRTRQTSATPLAVVVQDIYGNPIPGVVVEWEFIQGHGTLDADPDKPGNQATVESDKDGRAVLRQWTTGPVAGVQKVQASFTTGEVTKFVQFSVDVIPQLVSMDFFKTSVPEILRFLGRIANWNLILSGGIDKMAEADASVTVHFENVPIDEALDKILAMKNLTRVEQPDGSIKLMTFIEAQTSGQSLVTDVSQLDELPQDMVRTVILSISPRSDFAASVTAVEALLTGSGKIVSDPASRKIVVTDYVSVIRRVRDILVEFEKAEDRRVLTFNNLNFDAEQLKAFVTAQLPAEVKSLFIGKTVVLLGPTSAIDRIEEILRTLDLPENAEILNMAKSGQAVTRVFGLKYTQASKIAPLLRSLFGQSEFQVGLTAASGTGAAPAVAVPAARGAAATPGARGAATPAAPAASAAQTAAVTAAERVVTALEKVEAKSQKILVIDDDRTNKVIVTAPQEMMPSIATVISELDTVAAAIHPLVVRAQGVDMAQFQVMLTALYPGIRMMVDIPSGQLVLFVAPEFDSSILSSVIEALKSISPAASVKPLVFTTTSIDPNILQQMITALYPGYKVFIDPKLGKAILFVPLDFDERPIRTLLNSLSDSVAAGETVVIRKLKFANAAALAAVLKNLQAEAAASPQRASSRTTQISSFDEFGEPIVQSVVPPTPAPGTPAPPAGPPAASIAGITGAKINQLKIVEVAWINSLILIGPSDIVASVEKVIDAIDQRTGTWEAVSIKNGEDADKIVPVLQAIFPTAKFIPENSSNTLFIVVERLDELPEISRALEQVNQMRGDRAGETVAIIKLKYANAVEVDQTLAQTFAPQSISTAPALGSLGTGGNPEILKAYLDYLREENRKQNRPGGFRHTLIASKNTLIIQAANELVEKAIAIAKVIDVEDSLGQPLKTLFLKQVDPVYAISILSSIYPDVAFIPIPNSRLLLIRGISTRLELVAKDVAAMDLDGNLKYVEYQIKKAPPENVAMMLNQLVLNKDVTDPKLIREFYRISGKSIHVWAAPTTHKRIEELLPSIDMEGLPWDPQYVTEIYVFKNAPMAGMMGVTGSGWTTSVTFDVQVKEWLASANLGGFTQVSVSSGRGSNQAVIIGRPDGVARAKQFCVIMDEQWGRRLHDANYQILRLHYRSALEVTNSIGNIMSGYMLDIIPLDDRGSILVMTPPNIMDRVRELITVFDTITPSRILQPKQQSVVIMLPILNTLYPDVRALSMTGTPGVELILVQGATDRLEQYESTFRSLDIAGDIQLLKYGRLPAADAQALVTVFYPGIRIQSLSNGSILAAYGNKDAIAGAEKLLAEIEGGLQWRIVPFTRMTSTQATELIALIRNLFPALRLNSLPGGNGVVLIGTDVNLSEAIEMIRKIDMREIRLIPVREANLATVATTVTTFFPEAQIQSLATINSLSVSADSAVLEAIEKFIKGIDKAIHTAIRPLKHYDPTTPSELTDLTTTLRTYLSATGTLFFDRQSNSFVITDALEKVEKALSVLDDLDRAPPQFIIEAVIAEVAITDDKNLGIAWSSRPDLTDLGFLASTPLTAPAAGGASADFANGTFSLSLARNHLQATVTALLAKNDARIVATPKIVTRNNVQGVVNLKQSFPVTTTTPGAVGVAPQTTVTFQQVPIILTVTPSSTWSSDDIRLTVAADISVAGAPTITGAVVTSSRIVNTTVDMKDGQTLVIGGLMQKNKSEAVSKIPILGDIPGIGPLFRNTVAHEENREVLIFLSPRIIYPQEHDLQMEEELNRYHYLVNFPVDWSGRRWLMNNTQRNPGLREQMNQPSNYIIQPPAPPSPPAPPAGLRPQTMATPPPAAPRPSMTITTTTTTTRTPPAFEPEPEAPSPPGIVGGVTTTFNINTATAAELKSIPGMPQHVAQLIVAYRNANGSYQSLNDLLNVPGVSVELLEKSRKYLRMSTEQTPISPNPVAANEPPPMVQPSSPPPSPGSSMRVNLNTAGVDEFKMLPGIADNTARMIVAYRNTYGMFQTIDQLIDVPGVTPEMYGRIRDLVTVSGMSTGARPATFTPAPVAPPSASVANNININTATEAELATVPGFSTQNIKLIVAYRKKYGVFATVDDLINVPSITPEILSRVRGYLTTSEAANTPPEPAPAAMANLVNINTAMEAELRTVPGLSEQNVQLIIAYRKSYGPYKAVSEILEVPSITPEIYEAVKDRLTVQ